jgi:signal transduction histidine kinase
MAESRPPDVPADRAWVRERWDKADRSEVRAAVLRFLISGLITLLVVSIPVALWIRAQAERQCLDDAALRTRQLAEYTVGPLLDSAVRAGEQAAILRVDTDLKPWLSDGSLLRVKVWSSDGSILYSDRADQIGARYPLPTWSRDLFALGRPHTWYGQPADLDNVGEADTGELVEVNVRSADVAGRPVIFEAYFSDDALQNEQSQLWTDVLPVLVISLVILQLAQLPPAIGLARRIQAGQASRRWLVQHAVVASDFERRRIARELHDEVIQDLAGLSYALEAEEMHGTTQRSSLIGRARAILQRNLLTLRAITTDLYPPDLEQFGLHEALRRLGDHVAVTGIVVHADLSPDVPSDKEQLTVLYRVAREALANVVKHSHASVVEMVLSSDSEATSLSIQDNGVGFDASVAAPESHLGVRIMRDTVEMTGGTFSITSQEGEGTTVLMRINRS